MEAYEPTPEEERDVIRDINLCAEAQCKEGDTFYIITCRWWQDWLAYVNQDITSPISDRSSLYDVDYGESSCSPLTKRPSVIDNSDLIYDMTSEDSNGEMELRDSLIEGHDFVLLPEKVWERLCLWYGGGPALTRKVINLNDSDMELAVEVYPLRLQLLMMPEGIQASIKISKKETVGELLRQACEAFAMDIDQVCIWDYYGHQKHGVLGDMARTLHDVNLQMDQDVLVEVSGGCNNTIIMDFDNAGLDKISAKKVPASGNTDMYHSSYMSQAGKITNRVSSKNFTSELPQSQMLTYPVGDPDISYSIHSMGTRGSFGGHTGLHNLGNTCFMNSAIQCLVHTPEFARYFLDDFRQEINRKNPLGTVGELALAFGDLLRKIWSPGRAPISPRSFKSKLARFAPQFSGYNQHDSQELLAFLLDGLHEDLNRAKLKPYIKPRDAGGRPDEEIANEYWSNHIARNDSIIVDVCQGQYKSTLICNVCGKVSITFDPFMYLSLPLQSTTARVMTVTVFDSSGNNLPVAHTVTVPKHGRCWDLIQALSSSCNLKAGEKLVLAEIRGHFIHRLLDDFQILLSTVKDDDHLGAYRFMNLEGKTIFLQLVHRQEDLQSSSVHSRHPWKAYGVPLMIPISRDKIIRRGEIQLLIYKMLSPFLRDGSVFSGGVSLANAQGSMSKPRLQLVDQNNASIDLSVDEDKAVNVSSSWPYILIFVNWAQGDLKAYDTHYLEHLPEVFRYVPASKKSRSEPLSLYSCLEAFLREEPLVPEDMWYCSECKERRQASKKLDFWRLPKVLVIHLKRFSYSRSMKHKLETFVNFPIHDFNLTDYVADKNGRNQLYELYALSNHYGGMGSGHYTAHIKFLDENRWYNFDDTHVSPINEDDVKSAAAYLLFYRRVEHDDSIISNGVPLSPELGSYESQNLDPKNILM